MSREGVPDDHGPETDWGEHVTDAEYGGEQRERTRIVGRRRR